MGYWYRKEEGYLEKTSLPKKPMTERNGWGLKKWYFKGDLPGSISRDHNYEPNTILRRI